MTQTQLLLAERTRYVHISHCQLLFMLTSTCIIAMDLAYLLKYFILFVVLVILCIDNVRPFVAQRATVDEQVKDSNASFEKMKYLIFFIFI